jgi:hypothetical protein
MSSRSRRLRVGGSSAGAGMLALLTAAGRAGEHPDALGRQRDEQVHAFGDGQVAHDVDREIGHQCRFPRICPSTARSTRQKAPRNSMSATRTRRQLGMVGCTLRTTTSSGPYRQRDVVAGAGLDVDVAGKVHRAEAHPSRTHHDGVQEIGGADKIRHEGAGRLAVDLHRSADLLDHAVVHDHDPVGHGECLFLVVRDHDGRHAQALMQAPDLDAQVGPHAGIQRAEWLVQQQQARRQGQRTCQGHALLHAAGQLRRVFGAGVRQADQLEQFFDPGVDLDPGQAAADQPVADIRRHRQVREQRVALEHDAEVALGCRQIGYLALGLEDAAGGLDVEPGDGPQQRGLAAPGGPEKTDELARKISSEMSLSAEKAPNCFLSRSMRR